ncbi:hypothetical protein RRG08_047324 [Elysia crispata]|uniref:Uncharacterized protein n=1 Tax=Elysia crispata TaxID=231223 RepID=A0AAE1B2E0_9GAST|nr:hypothetical protein RRG08_047324 [Elysia crispata]
MDKFGFGVDKWAWYTVSDILHYYEHECNVNSLDLDRGDAWFLEWIQRAPGPGQGGRLVPRVDTAGSESGQLGVDVVVVVVVVVVEVSTTTTMSATSTAWTWTGGTPGSSSGFSGQ